MNTKFLLIAVFAVIVVITSAYYFISPMVRDLSTSSVQRTVPGNRTTVTEGAFVPREFGEPIQKTNDALVTTTETSTSTEQSYTTDIVATHNNETSCWSTINGNVYDLTTIISKQLDVDQTILKICGKDGTSTFIGQYGDDSKPESTLQKFYLGKVQ
jgi:cytochrome b involved in lipid metabolism